jgi:hypothetical protein
LEKLMEFVEVFGEEEEREKTKSGGIPSFKA